MTADGEIWGIPRALPEADMCSAVGASGMGGLRVVRCLRVVWVVYVVCVVWGEGEGEPCGGVGVGARASSGVRR